MRSPTRTSTSPSAVMICVSLSLISVLAWTITSGLVDWPELTWPGAPGWRGGRRGYRWCLRLSGQTGGKRRHRGEEERLAQHEQVSPRRWATLSSVMTDTGRRAGRPERHWLLAAGQRIEIQVLLLCAQLVARPVARVSGLPATAGRLSDGGSAIFSMRDQGQHRKQREQGRAPCRRLWGRGAGI